MFKTLEEQEAEFQSVRQYHLDRKRSIKPVIIIIEELLPVTQPEIVPKPKRSYTKYPKHWSAKLRLRYSQYKTRAKEDGRVFNLSFSEFESLLSGECVYCGTTDNMTIDRIDSAQGYTLSNSQSCCNACNTMKMNMTHKKFIEQVNAIAHHQQQALSLPKCRQ